MLILFLLKLIKLKVTMYQLFFVIYSKGRRVFALTTGDTFRAMTTMAGASLIAIDQVVIKFQLNL